MSEHTATDTKTTPKPSAIRFLMPAVVLGFLGLHMIFIFTAMSIAMGDRSFAVVPNYYQRAVDWDDHKAQLAASAELGWTVSVLPSRAVSMHGERELAVLILDDADLALRGAHVEATFYPRVRANQVEEIELIETNEPGRYAALAHMQREGVWDVTVRVTLDDDAYLHEDTVFVQGRYEGSGP